MQKAFPTPLEQSLRAREARRFPASRDYRFPGKQTHRPTLPTAPRGGLCRREKCIARRPQGAAREICVAQDPLPNRSAPPDQTLTKLPAPPDGATWRKPRKGLGQDASRRSLAEREQHPSGGVRSTVGKRLSRPGDYPTLHPSVSVGPVCCTGRLGAAGKSQGAIFLGAGAATAAISLIGPTDWRAVPLRKPMFTSETHFSAGGVYS